MFKRSFYTCFGVIVGLFCALSSSAQVVATSDYNVLPAGVIENLSGDTVCSSLSTGDLSIDTFRVTAVAIDVGDSHFEWVVYGGTIVYDNGGAGANNASPQSVGGVSYHYIANDNFSYLTDTESKIKVQWDEQDVSNAWVAVRQISEWGCTDSIWKVYVSDVFNKKPILLSNFPPHINIAYDSRSGFVLPDPSLFSQDPDAHQELLPFMEPVFPPILKYIL